MGGRPAGGVVKLLTIEMPDIHGDILALTRIRKAAAQKKWARHLVKHRFTHRYAAMQGGLGC